MSSGGCPSCRPIWGMFVSRHILVSQQYARTDGRSRQEVGETVERDMTLDGRFSGLLESFFTSASSHNVEPAPIPSPRTGIPFGLLFQFARNSWPQLHLRSPWRTQCSFLREVLGSNWRLIALTAPAAAIYASLRSGPSFVLQFWRRPSIWAHPDACWRFPTNGKHVLWWAFSPARKSRHCCRSRPRYMVGPAGSCAPAHRGSDRSAASEITSIRQQDVASATGAHVRCEGKGAKNDVLLWPNPP